MWHFGNEMRGLTIIRTGRKLFKMIHFYILFSHLTAPPNPGKRPEVFPTGEFHGVLLGLEDTRQHCTCGMLMTSGRVKEYVDTKCFQKRGQWR